VVVSRSFAASSMLCKEVESRELLEDEQASRNTREEKRCWMIRVGLAGCTAAGKGFPGGTSITTVESQRPIIGFPTPLASGKEHEELGPSDCCCLCKLISKCMVTSLLVLLLNR